MTTATTETTEKPTYVSGKKAAAAAGCTYLALLKLAAVGVVRTRATLGAPTRFCLEDAAKYKAENA